MPDRNGKIFYTSITSLSHISKCTKLIIAQRIASVRFADRILVMEKGRILDMGSHEELLERCPVYQQIFASQNRGEQEEGRDA